MSAARRALALALVAFAAWHFGQGGWIHAKAALAQHLLERAWARTLDGEQAVRPWAWADTWPVARLTLPRQGASLIVLDGASGRNLAFGPAHLSATAPPGSTGNAVIAGHRDTHFAALANVLVGDPIEVETAAGRSRYRVRSTAVVSARDGRVTVDDGRARLTLVTCYPFRGVRPGTEQRFVVHAERVDDAAPG